MIKKHLIYLLILISSVSFGQEKSLLAKDVTISLGAGKNKFFEKREFAVAVPIELPSTIIVGLNNQFEFGIEYAPILFNDRSSSDFQGLDSTRNHFGGNLQSFNAILQYSLNNNYRFNGYLQATGGYSMLHKKRWIVGDLNEVIGEGHNWSIGCGARYQLGNMYDDVFPWFFDFSLVYTRYNIEITDFLIENIQQPKVNSTWDPLNFGAVDVVLRIGYRFRKK